MDNLNLWLVGGGLFSGLLFGIVVQRTQFCMVSAVSNAVLMRDFRHAHGYFAALLVAILGTLFLETGGLIAISETGYRVPRYDWLVITGGGLLFGFGSMLAGGCAGRTTVRAAEGNLGAFVVLLAFALTAAATYFGALEPYRVWLIQNTSIELDAGDSALSAILGLPLWVVPAVIAAACLVGILSLGQARRSSGLITAGIVVGALVVAGWYITGYLSQDDFSEHRASSITIAGPLARATVFLTTGSLPGGGFTVSVLMGIVAGALASALCHTIFSPDYSGGTSLEALACRRGIDGNRCHLCRWLQYWSRTDRHVDCLDQGTYSIGGYCCGYATGDCLADENRKGRREDLPPPSDHAQR